MAFNSSRALPHVAIQRKTKAFVSSWGSVSTLTTSTAQWHSGTSQFLSQHWQPQELGPQSCKVKQGAQTDWDQSDRQVEIMEEEAHWKGLFVKLTADPKNMAVCGLFYSELWVESLCSTQHCENKQKPLANYLWVQYRSHFENGPRIQAAMDFGGFQHSPVVLFSRIQIWLFCGTKQKLLSECLWKVTLSTNWAPKLPFTDCIVGIFCLLGHRFSSLTHHFSGTAETVIKCVVQRRDTTSQPIFSKGKPPTWLSLSIISTEGYNLNNLDSFPFLLSRLQF